MAIPKKEQEAGRRDYDNITNYAEALCTRIAKDRERRCSGAQHLAVDGQREKSMISDVYLLQVIFEISTEFTELIELKGGIHDQTQLTSRQSHLVGTHVFILKHQLSVHSTSQWHRCWQQYFVVSYSDATSALSLSVAKNDLCCSPPSGNIANQMTCDQIGMSVICCYHGNRVLYPDSIL